MKQTFTRIGLILIFILYTHSHCFSQTAIGNDYRTQLNVYEYYNHVPSEWIKLFRVNDDGWDRGSVSGFVHFVDYDGEGAGMVEFTIPQRITPTQKPTLVLHGNAADDFSWHVFQNNNGDLNGYDVYIKAPDYHVGFTFMLRGYSWTPYFSSASAPVAAPIWTSIAI